MSLRSVNSSIKAGTLGRAWSSRGEGNGATLPGLALVPRRVRPLDKGFCRLPTAGKSEAADVLTLALHRRKL
jgi:hypothetical protein